MSDLIRRKDVEFVIQTRTYDLANSIQKGLMLNAIDNIPSAEPERKWIPVSEALPKDMDKLLATIVRSNGEKRVRSGNYYNGYFMMDNGDTWNETDKEILAWMPLPEPYRGDR